MINIRYTKESFIKVLQLSLALAALFALSACTDPSYSDTMESMEENYREVANCWGCTIFSALYNAINDMIEVLYPEICEGALGLLAMIFALWIAYRTGKMLFSFKEPDTAEFWTDFAKMSFAVFFCAMIVTSESLMLEALSYTLVPVFEAAMDFAVAVISQSFAAVGVEGDYVSCTIDMSERHENAILTDNLKESFICLIYQIHSRLTYGIFMAQKIMFVGVVQFFYALITLAIFYLLAFMFPFYLVDGIFRIGIILVLFPLLVIFWPFKVLRSYTKAGWDLFFGSMIHIMVMAIFVTIMVEVFTSFVFQGITIKDIDSQEFVQSVDESPVALLCMVFLGFYAIKFMGNLRLIASQFSGAKANSSIFSDAATKMMRMSAYIAKAAASSTRTVGMKGLGAMQGKFGSSGGNGGNGGSASGGGGGAP